MLRGERSAGSIGDLGTVYSDPGMQKQRVLLFVAPPGSISDALAAAVEREFRWISVRIVPELALAQAKFDAAVQLILVDMAYVDELMKCWHELQVAHPSASAAITASRCSARISLLKSAAERRAICGVVPMDVNLDIWLSIIRIMLKGGEYFPPELIQRTVNIDSARDEPDDPVENVSPVMKGLTTRELEVLSCVAKGLQNKLIAAELGLSEHTIKIHIHNIIRKLGAHNRTEAAALYFRCVAGENGASNLTPGAIRV